jgi:hypothetical protein
MNCRVIFLVPARPTVHAVRRYDATSHNCRTKCIRRRTKTAVCRVKAFTMADPNTHTTPSAAPVTACKDTTCTTRHRCVCNREDCADFQRKIRELADPSHCWNSRLIQISNRPNSWKATALRSSIIHHLRPTVKDQNKEHFYVTPHHWSQSLWQDMVGARNSAGSDGAEES